jgi:CRISPR-associated endonuclease/helicase Cas3
MLGKNVQSRELETVPLELCIAKTSGNIPGVSVETHCRIVGLVAKELISLFPPDLQGKLFPIGVDFIAACHDVGKVSPAFQKMIYMAVGNIPKEFTSIFDLTNQELAGRSESGFHAAVSQVSVDGCGQFIPEMLGIHHGFTPNTLFADKGCALHGGLGWQGLRDELLRRLRNYFNIDPDYWPHVPPETAGVISGLITVADWIGSGDYFSEVQLDTTDSQGLRDKARSSVIAAGFHSVKVIHGLGFSSVFGFQPNEIQERLIDIVSGPGVYVLEAPMGIGKTEAALYAAYTLLDKGLATGIYFALPTQLTSEKIHERMESFLTNVQEKELGVDHARLLHGTACLKENSMGEDADAGGSWFDGTKRGILAPFAVGTIDQALMSVMNVRHGYVRTFGLAGKVVILDEVHSYDAYTGTIVTRLVQELRAINCTVIILSATLMSSQRKTLLSCEDGTALSMDYPLISAVSGSAKTTLREVPCGQTRGAVVQVSCENNIDKVLKDVIIRVSRGEQVLWIENTVAEAQSAYFVLSPFCREIGAECGLLHSRFIKKDREEIENYWVSLFGKEGTASRSHNGRVLVGTQVLEQSIDIDADYLVSRICPTDMLLQRIGRLWRHRKNDPIRPKESRRSMAVLTPSYSKASSIPHQFGPSGFVYSEYVLLRTLEIWKDLRRVSIPTDIRQLIEKTYSVREEEGFPFKLKGDLASKIELLQGAARVGLSHGIKTLPETKASTRYSEIETTDVLLLRDMRECENGLELAFTDGSRITVPTIRVGRESRRIIGAALLRNTVKVSESQAPEVGDDISWAEQFVYTGSKENEEYPFRVAFIARDEEVVNRYGTSANDSYRLHYSTNLGYQSERSS